MAATFFITTQLYFCYYLISIKCNYILCTNNYVFSILFSTLFKDIYSIVGCRLRNNLFYLWAKWSREKSLQNATLVMRIPMDRDDPPTLKLRRAGMVEVGVLGNALFPRVALLALTPGCYISPFHYSTYFATEPQSKCWTSGCYE
jgi:hypothetical protein